MNPFTRFKNLVLLTSILFLLSGCASFGTLQEDPMSQAFWGIASRQATKELIERDTDTKARAEKILRVSALFEPIVFNESLTLIEMQNQLMEKIPLYWSDLDKQSAKDFIAGIVAIIQARVDELAESEKLQTEQFAARFFFNNVVSVARFYADGGQA